MRAFADAGVFVGCLLGVALHGADAHLVMAALIASCITVTAGSGDGGGLVLLGAPSRRGRYNLKVFQGPKGCCVWVGWCVWAQAWWPHATG